MFKINENKNGMKKQIIEIIKIIKKSKRNNNGINISIKIKKKKNFNIKEKITLPYKTTKKKPFVITNNKKIKKKFLEKVIFININELFKIKKNTKSEIISDEKTLKNLKKIAKEKKQKKLIKIIKTAKNIKEYKFLIEKRFKIIKLNNKKPVNIKIGEIKNNNIEEIIKNIIFVIKKIKKILRKTNIKKEKIKNVIYSEQTKKSFEIKDVKNKF